jgi:hypothetical protein
MKMLTYDMIIIPLRNHESHKTIKRRSWPGRKNNNNQRLLRTDLNQLIMMDHNYASNRQFTTREQRTNFAPPLF